MSVSLTQEQFQQLLASVGSGRKGSMTSCKATYDGRKDRETVEAFLTAVQVFKKLENISDDDALAALPLILREDAAVWWQGTKNTITTWDKFQNALRNTFAPKKPVYEIYIEACGTKQASGISTDDFVTKKRMLFSELPSDEQLNLKQQLNITYGLLNLTIREKVPRDTVKDFDDLLKQARSAEALLKEKAGEDREETSDQTAETSRSETTVSISTRTKAPRCNFCKKLGHVLEECRKRKKTMEADQERTDMAQSTFNEVKFSCYGCGTPGVYRSNCKLCANKPTEAPEKNGNLGFCAINVQLDKRSRPMVFVEVNGIKGRAYVDTCAKISVASRELYEMLKARGQTFYEELATITLADGHSKLQRVLTFEAVVNLCGRRLKTPFIVLLQSHDNRTLLGIDFLQAAGIILNIAQFTWSYIQKPQQEFELYQERFVMFERPDTTAAVSVAPIDMERGKRLASETDTISKMELKSETAALPPKMKCSQGKLLFDGYSPRMEYMMRDAIQNIEEAEITLSPHAATLFDDVGLSSLDVTTAIDKVHTTQLDELPQLATTMERTRGVHKMEEDLSKELVDQYSSARPDYISERSYKDTVSLHPMSYTSLGISAKFAPRRDRPHQVTKQHEPSSYAVACLSHPDLSLGIYHASALTPYVGPKEGIPTPVQPLRERGRPRKGLVQVRPARGRGRPKKQ